MVYHIFPSPRDILLAANRKSQNLTYCDELDFLNFCLGYFTFLIRNMASVAMDKKTAQYCFSPPVRKRGKAGTGLWSSIDGWYILLAHSAETVQTSSGNATVARFTNWGMWIRTHNRLNIFGGICQIGGLIPLFFYPKGTERRYLKFLVSLQTQMWFTMIKYQMWKNHETQLFFLFGEDLEPVHIVLQHWREEMALE